MKALSKILTGAAGLAAMVGVASPATAQSYPYGYGYPNSGGVLGTILNGVLGGGGQYGYGNYGGQYGGQYGNQQYLVQQCATESQRRISQISYGGGYGSPYGGYNNGYGYNGGYNAYGNGSARIAGITTVERKSYGYRIKGDAFSGNNAYGGYNGGYNNPYGGYNNGYGYNSYNSQPDITFSCRVDQGGRVLGVELYNRQNGRRIG